LWVFTSVITLLVAWFTAATAAGGAVALPVFAAASALAMGASALHLGRPIRAWRGILNWKYSWISREALLVTLFLASACAMAFFDTPPSSAAWVTAVVGFAALFAMDMVYRVTGQTVSAVPHSAMATLTAAYYLGLLLATPALALPAAAVKLALYLLRRERFAHGGKVLAIVRVAAGLVFPWALLAVDGLSPWLLVALAATGELIDRAEFYAGLEFLTPKIQIARDIAHPK
jgi:DMSO reductase anchor subunit